jgi:hypothetical protein
MSDLSFSQYLATLDAEDLACAGLWRAGHVSFFSEIAAAVAAQEEKPAQPCSPASSPGSVGKAHETGNGADAFAKRRGRPRKPTPPPTNGLRARVEVSGLKPERDISPAAFHTETSMPTMPSPQSDRPPSWSKLELERIRPLREVEEMTSLDRDTLVRVYPQYLRRVSPKRLGMKFRDVLKIINGDAFA